MPAFDKAIKTGAAALTELKPFTYYMEDLLPELSEFGILSKTMAGISRKMPWMYSGAGIAGWHAENSFMPFYNWSPEIKFSGLDGLGDGGLAKAVVDFITQVRCGVAPWGCAPTRRGHRERRGVAPW